MVPNGRAVSPVRQSGGDWLRAAQCCSRLIWRMTARHDAFAQEPVSIMSPGSRAGSAQGFMSLHRDRYDPAFTEQSVILTGRAEFRLLALAWARIAWNTFVSCTARSANSEMTGSRRFKLRSSSATGPMERSWSSRQPAHDDRNPFGRGTGLETDRHACGHDFRTEGCQNFSGPRRREPRSLPRTPPDPPARTAPASQAGAIECPDDS